MTAVRGNPFETFSRCEDRPGSAAMVLSRTPKWIARVVSVLVLLLLALPFVLLFAPWQQTVRGSGRVVAYAPVDRQQAIEAPISGRVVELWVGEGTRVAEGDPIFEIADIDPLRIQRLESQLAAERSKLEAFRAQFEQNRQGVENVRAVGDLKVDAFRARRDQAERSVEEALASLDGARAERNLAERQLARMRALIPDEAVSQRQLEVAEADYEKAEAGVTAAEARVESARADLTAAQRELEGAGADRDAKVNTAEATLQETRSKIANAEQMVVDLEGQISRQRSQLVTAPRDGIIHRVEGYQDGDIVSAGEPVVVLVPDTQDRAVEMWVDGNDAPLISVGSAVRLQFEGWPAIQFAGWPSVAVGTFGGRVALVDPTDDGQGRFRTLVVPNDPEEWPGASYLRQGVRTKGWVLLNEVSLGWELWRQLNGFPPVVAQEPPEGAARKRVK